MKIVKEAAGGQGAAVTEQDLALIGALARRPMEAEEVYTFSVRLCDNEIDRDFERFAPQTLEELAPMFVGKAGIFDHQWSARGQAARIYKTEVVREPERTTRAGDGYCWLKGYAYMVRTESDRDLIAEIEGGIKKEVSVGCAVEHAVCSVCGCDRAQTDCGHEKGKEYGGQLCWASLEGAKDAYEFSFVAVPAQPRAGVVKTARWGGGQALERLEEEAALGRKYLEELRGEVVRMAVLADRELDGRAMRSLADKLSHQELEELRRSYARRAGERFPLKTQLNYETKHVPFDEENRAFLG
ncbi:hypothetical protein D7V91_05235 [bacterium 1xD42-67]|nr:hypothetical protein D7V91_05235 [bacterium 1xD42-67]